MRTSTGKQWQKDDTYILGVLFEDNLCKEGDPEPGRWRWLSKDLAWAAGSDLWACHRPAEIGPEELVKFLDALAVN